MGKRKFCYQEDELLLSGRRNFVLEETNYCSRADINSFSGRRWIVVPTRCPFFAKKRPFFARNTHRFPEKNKQFSWKFCTKKGLLSFFGQQAFTNKQKLNYGLNSSIHSVFEIHKLNSLAGIKRMLPLLKQPAFKLNTSSFWRLLRFVLLKNTDIIKKFNCE